VDTILGYLATALLELVREWVDASSQRRATVFRSTVEATCRSDRASRARNRRRSSHPGDTGHPPRPVGEAYELN